eukprot:TRINITY_DN24136_c0_g1_i1.p1 TRINITY_DN24136_c0_g1~~TRINITY_DN24136_c0_g1_i1.p1  ORF type:complete len:588 (+),score=93.66 TRINITY_DN24136_c0_g1_i1:38-1801(+)
MPLSGQLSMEDDDADVAQLLPSQQPARRWPFSLLGTVVLALGLATVLAAASCGRALWQGRTAVQGSIAMAESQKHVFLDQNDQSAAGHLKHFAEVVAQMSDSKKVKKEAAEVERDIEKREQSVKIASLSNDLTSKVGNTITPEMAAEAGADVTSADIDAINSIADPRGHLSPVAIPLEKNSIEFFQDDMAATSKEQLQDFAGTAAQNMESGKSYGAGKPWSGGVVKYCLSDGVHPEIKKSVNLAIDQYKKAVPCLTWKDVGYKGDNTCHESPAIVVKSDNDLGCWGYVGMISSWESQPLQLAYPGCNRLGTVIHEMGHALGMAHEQARPDRDTYVSIQWRNIQSGMEGNFRIDGKGDTSQPYDILSVMHYSATSFGGGSSTIHVKPAGYAKYTADPNEYSKYQPGQRVGLSQADADQLAAHYASELTCHANKLATDHPCTDLEVDGKPWKDSHGQDCSTYVSMEKTGQIESCSQYSSGTYCCECGGGLRLQRWEAPRRRRTSNRRRSAMRASDMSTPGPVPSPMSAPTPAPTPAPAPVIAESTCKDSTTYKDPLWGASCSGWKGYRCWWYFFSGDLEANCPEACGKC